MITLPSIREELETIKLGMDLFSELGGCDERTKLLLKDKVRNVLLKEKLQPSLTSTNPGRLEYPVSDRAIALGYKPNNTQLQQIGKRASRLYQEKYNSKPPQREQFVGGTMGSNFWQLGEMAECDRAWILIGVFEEGNE